jgi:hypothetical protein
MQARYGHEDPLVLQLQADMLRMTALANTVERRHTVSHPNPPLREQRAATAH